MAAVGAEARRLYRAAAPDNRQDYVKPKVSASVAPVAVSLFDKAVAVFQKLFQSDTDVRSARLRFRNISQGPDESNVIYLANLREAVEACNFSELSDEMLRQIR